MKKTGIIILSLLLAVSLTLVSCTAGENIDNDDGSLSENEAVEKENGNTEDIAPVKTDSSEESVEKEDEVKGGDEEQGTPGFTEYPIKMMMADGFLYYDTGEASRLTPRCGTLDAHFSDFCEESSVPTKDGMANFTTGDAITGWQNASDITKEVYLGTDWRIFRKLSLTPDILESGLDRCVRRAFDDGSECLMFYKETEQENGTQVITVPVKYGSVFDWGITLSSKDISSSGMTLVITQSGGNAIGELQTGTYFGLDRYNEKFWEPVKPVIDNGAWTMIAYLIKDDSDNEFRCDWEWLYGKLPAGKYRIHKDITDFKKTANYDEHRFYLEFEITEQ